MSMKNSDDTIGNRSHDLPTCSAVPQPTAPPRTYLELCWNKISCQILADFYIHQKSYRHTDIFLNFNSVDTRWQWYSTHLHTNSTQNNTINLGRVLAVPHLCELYPGYLPYNWGKSMEKPQSGGSRKVPVGTMKTEYTEQNIHNNKNT